MCREAVRAGVRTIVAVQSWSAGREEPALSFNACQRKLERLQAEMGDALKLKQGFVFRFHPALDETVAQYSASVTLGGGRHVLVALPAVRTPAETEEVLERLMSRGFAVVLAAPECSHDLRRNRARLEGWIERGVKLQLNASSIAGAHGREAQRFALDYAKQYRAHAVVASNARAAHRPTLADAREIITRQLGKRVAQTLFEETPALILETPADACVKQQKPDRPFNLLARFFTPKKATSEMP